MPDQVPSSEGVATRGVAIGPKAKESRPEGGSFFYEGFFKRLQFLTMRSTREVETKSGGVKIGGR